MQTQCLADAGFALVRECFVQVPGRMHRWFPAVVPGPRINVLIMLSSCENLVGADGFEPPASRL